MAIGCVVPVVIASIFLLIAVIVFAINAVALARLNNGIIMFQDFVNDILMRHNLDDRVGFGGNNAKMFYILNAVMSGVFVIALIIVACLAFFARRTSFIEPLNNRQ
jgi:uncharacterized membrane protein YbaN (DUF454 family)